MSIGLLALLDDVAAMVKMSAATLEALPTQVAQTGVKVSGIVIDDAAVTPQYVEGIAPARELHVIYRIAKSSMFNKLVFLAPGALVLGFVAPFLIQPILMMGGAYLCFEGYEKVHAMGADDRHTEADDVKTVAAPNTPKEREDELVASAVKTDFILSAEIVAITYGSVADKDIMTQIIVLIAIAVGITVAVYGVVGLLVKMDDIGLYFATRSRKEWLRGLGRYIVRAMPQLLTILGIIGTAAMLWVGAGIIIHGIAPAHHALESFTHALSFSPVLAWLAGALVSAIVGVAIGWVIASILHTVQGMQKKAH